VALRGDGAGADHIADEDGDIRQTDAEESQADAFCGRNTEGFEIALFARLAQPFDQGAIALGLHADTLLRVFALERVGVIGFFDEDLSFLKNHFEGGVERGVQSFFKLFRDLLLDLRAQIAGARSHGFFPEGILEKQALFFFSAVTQLIINGDEPVFIIRHGAHHCGALSRSTICACRK